MFSSYGVKVYCPVNIGEDGQVDFTKHAEFTQSTSIWRQQMAWTIKFYRGMIAISTHHHFTCPTCVPKTVVISASYMYLLKYTYGLQDITMAVGVQFLWTCPGRRSGSWWCAQIWMILMGGMTHQRVVNKHAFTTLFDTIYDYIPHYLILYDFTWG